MVNYKYGDLFKKDTVDKQLSIVSDDGKTLSTTWEYPDNATFALSDDGMYLIETDCEEMDYAEGTCLNLTREL